MASLQGFAFRPHLVLLLLAFLVMAQMVLEPSQFNRGLYLVLALVFCFGAFIAFSLEFESASRNGWTAYIEKLKRKMEEAPVSKSVAAPEVGGWQREKPLLGEESAVSAMVGGSRLQELGCLRELEDQLAYCR